MSASQKTRSKRILFAIFSLLAFNSLGQKVGIGIGVDWYYLQVVLDLTLIGIAQFIGRAKRELTGLLVVSIIVNLTTAYDYLWNTNYLYDHYSKITPFLFDCCLWTLLIHLMFVAIKK